MLLATGWFLIIFCTASRTLGIQLRQVVSNVFLLSCLLISSYFYVKTYFSLRRHKLRIQNQVSFSMAYYRKSLNSMFLVFCLFLATYLPFVCALAVVVVLGFESFSLLALDITSLVALLNSSLNPIVYCWRVKDIKREVKRVLHGTCPCFTTFFCKFRSNRVMPFNTSSISQS